MKKYYYQLKTKEQGFMGGVSYWGKATMKGIVEADTPKEARNIVKTQILCRDINTKEDDILLSIIEVTPEKQYLLDFFKPRVCKQCGRVFTNSVSGFYSSEFCCENCYELYNYEHLDVDKYLKIREIDNIDFYDCNPCIYVIHNTENGKNYVGQTVRSFTLRWWEHYKAWIKFCPEDITKFQFAVLEEFSKEEVKKNPDLLSEREQFWIDLLEAYTKGYNSRNEIKEKLQYQKKELNEVMSKNV